MNKIKNVVRIGGVILWMPVFIVRFLIASYNCDAYEWDGTGYDN